MYVIGKLFLWDCKRSQTHSKILIVVQMGVQKGSRGGLRRGSTWGFRRGPEGVSNGGPVGVQEGGPVGGPGKGPEESPNGGPNWDPEGVQKGSLVKQVVLILVLRIEAKLNARQCWPAVSPRVLVRCVRGVLFRGPTGLTARLRMSSDLRLLILSDSSKYIIKSFLLLSVQS